MNSLSRLSLFLAAASTLGPGRAADGPNRFQAGARLLFNAQASFGGIGGLPAPVDPGPPTGGGLDRQYDDGYVRRDADGNAGGLTWNWGYLNPAQVPGDDTLRLNATRAVADGQSGAEVSEPALGYEMAWLRDFRRTERYAWGAKVAFGYTRVQFEETSSVPSSGERWTDVYALGGILPPGNPGQPGWQYQGVAGLPGPLIPDQPLRREILSLPGAAVTTGSRELDTAVWSFKAGPWIELPLCPRVNAQLGGGVALAYLHADFAFQEMTTPAAGGMAAPRSGQGSGSDLVVGGYAEALLNTHLTDALDLVLGAEFLGFQRWDTRLGGRPVELDLGSTWSLHAGFSLSF